ncbi:D-2-hydroxyacid dehydrogenase [Clostridium mediterraneense]|uniref:D-2-hydroxyacid dehydrogenase n=1 Tax=Clostridium mediterraneense TaxID=1805472 RepID=UPI000837948B|nr:D-2-hydroxyacid dehydrogenase [Clostridium mediterraneense]
MKKIVILDAKTMGEFNFNKLSEIGELETYELSSYEEAKDRIKDANIVITNKVVLNEGTLKDAKNLELICEMATGYNNIDIEYAKSRNIAVTNVAGYSTNTVVQHTFAMLFNIYNKLAYYDNYVKSGEYTKSDIFTHLDKSIVDLEGKTWGIIGLGQIGKKVANLAKVFGAEVIYYSTSGRNSDSEFTRVEFEELLKKSDVISIHAPLNENTKGLMNYEAFKKMKNSAVLLNLGRGPIVVESDLAKAIDKDLIGAAALDVFEYEPMHADNALLKVEKKDKLLLTPHVAWASLEARTRLFEDMMENIRAFYRGEMRNRI